METEERTINGDEMRHIFEWLFSSCDTGHIFEWLFSSCDIWHKNGQHKHGFVYIMRGDNSTVKIGFTGKREGIQMRLDEHCRQYCMGFVLLYALESHCARGLESKIHKWLSPCRVMGSGGRELFAPTEQQLLALAKITTFAGQPVKQIPGLEFL